MMNNGVGKAADTSVTWSVNAPLPGPAVLDYSTAKAALAAFCNACVTG